MSIHNFTGCLLLGALGDTLGFKNGFWEFYDCKDNYDSIIKEFDKLGGYKNIDLKNWNISDDTLLTLATANGILKKTDRETFMKKEFIECYKKYALNSNINRYFGTTTLDKIEQLIDGRKYEKFKFQESDGGSGCAMRTMPIGLYYHKKENINSLIYYSFINSILTHTHPMAYLGGIVVALFTSFAIQKKPIERWITKMLKIFNDKNNILIKTLKKMNKIDIYYEYKNTFFSYWVKYYYLRFKKGKYVPNNKWTNLQYRMDYFIEHFEPGSGWLGSTGTGAVLYSYDSLLLAKNDFQKLIYLTCLSCGDSDTLGMISCSLWGAYYNYNNVPKHLLKNIELKGDIIKISKKLYNK